MAGRFDGLFSTDGGSLFQGNRFDTNGGPICFDSRLDNVPPAHIRELPDFILSPCFTGRSDELLHIDHVLSASSGDYPQRCVIYGMPGVGKTQLALQYATLAFQKAQHPYVFWVSAVSVEKLFRDFSKLADLARLSNQYTRDPPSKLTVVRAWLEDTTPAKSWLMVLDNVSEETVAALREVLPRGDCGGRLLMTTRTATIANIFTNSNALCHLALRPPKTDEAIAMLFAGIKLQQEDTEEAYYRHAEHLVKSVGNLPLAIDQAASFIRDTGSDPQATLTMQKGEQATEIFSWENDLSRHEEKSVIATFMPALVKIKENAPDALALLRLFCFCDPEGIPIGIFEQGGELLFGDSRYKTPQIPDLNADHPGPGPETLLRKVHSDPKREIRQDTCPGRQTFPERGLEEFSFVGHLLRSPLRLAKAIQEVQRLSLAAQVLEGSERIIRIHDLVHVLLRSILLSDTDRAKWLEIAVCILCTSFQEIGDYKSPRSWNKCGRFISHIESLAGFAERYELESIEMSNASSDAASYLCASGLYQKAANLFTWSLGQYEKILGERNPITLKCMHNLASVLDDQGLYEEAEQIQRRTLSLQESLLGKQHPETLASMNNLAIILDHQGQEEEAEQIYRQTLSLRESLPSKHNADTFRLMNNLASVLDQKRQYEEAERLYRRTLSLQESVLGKQHPDVLSSMNNLALVLDHQRQYKKAEELYRQTLFLRESILGKQHPDTLRSMNNLALVLKNQGQCREAIPLMEWCVQLRKQVLGPDHPHTQGSLNNLRILREELSDAVDEDP